jgi:hypothetical protein
MKQTPLLLLLFLACLVSKIGLTQTYFPLPDSNAVWSVGLTKYLVKGDSVLNSTSYKKYYFSSDSALSPASLKFAGLVRDDTAQKKIYGVLKNKTAEQLLYDFNLKKLDTVTVGSLYDPNFTGRPYTVRVSAVDSVLITGKYHKRYELTSFHFNGSFSEFWIEGVGSTDGPLEPGVVDCGIADVCLPTLLCLYHNNVRIYIDTVYNSCYVNTCLTGIQEQEGKIIATVYPNPGCGMFTLRTENVFSAQLEVINSFGKRIIQRQLTGNSTPVDLSGEAKGIYCYRLVSETKTLTSGKLVVY